MLGYYYGTGFIFVKSEPYPRSLESEDSSLDYINENYEFECNNEYKLICKRKKNLKILKLF